MAAENAGLYLEMLKSHSDHILRHYNGSPSEDSLPFEETFVPPNTYWTSDEKYKLYHHLQRFSRFRLDLVAEAMGTKTVVEVSTYLGLVARVVHERYSRHAAPRRDRFPAAIEMKNAWVEFEEGMSQYVLEAEDETIRSELAASRRLSCKNAGVVPHHVGVGAFVKESFRMLRSTKLQNGHDIPASKLSSIPTGSLKFSWIEEDLFRELDKDNLSVMDDMLDSHYGLDSSSHHAPLATNSDAAHDSHSDDDNPSVSPARDSLTDKKGSLETSRTKLAMMSPLERQRYRKRLWMRKKRAQEKLVMNAIDPSFVVFNKSTGRLSKRRRTSAMDPFSTPSTVRAFPEDAALGDLMNYQRKRTEKFDLVKKVAQYVNFTAGNLIQDDVDIFYFSRLGNLLRMYMSSLLPLPESRNPSHGGSIVSSPNGIANPAVSYSTIKQIARDLRQYLEIVIQRTILIAENSRDTRTQPQITKYDVLKSASIFSRPGAFLSRKSFIQTLPSRLSLTVLDGSVPADVSDLEGLVEFQPRMSIEGPKDIFISCADINGPSLSVPVEYRRPNRMAMSKKRNYEDQDDENFLTMWGVGQDEGIPGCELLPEVSWPVEYDEFLEELIDEDKLDKRDSKGAARYHAALWNMFQAGE